MSKRARILAVASVAAFLIPTAAQASYPGRNGAIATHASSSDPYLGPKEFITRVYPDGRFLLRFGPGPDDPESSNHNMFGRPVYSPSGRHIAFDLNVWDNRSSDIWIARADNSDWRRITRNSAHDESPSWSPNGKRLVFRSSRSGETELYIIGADGQNLRRIPNSGPRVANPVWSPLGDRIAFITDWDRDDPSSYQQDIWTIRPDGTGLERVTNDGHREGSLDWAPDGSRLMFTRGAPNAVEVVTITPDGSDEDVIVEGGAQAAYSPDGKWIAYFGAIGDELYLLRARSDGSDVTPVRRARGEISIGGQPTWQPLRPSMKSTISMHERDKVANKIPIKGRVEPMSAFERVRLTLRVVRSHGVVDRKDLLTGYGGGFWAWIGERGSRDCILKARFLGDARLFSDSTRIRTHC